MYAAMLYWLIASFWPRMRPLPLGLAAMTATTAVEVFKLVHTPALDAFRLTLAGRLLLGRFFSFQDLVVYAAAICVSMLLDKYVPSR